MALSAPSGAPAESRAGFADATLEKETLTLEPISCSFISTDSFIKDLAGEEDCLGVGCFVGER